MKLPTRTVSALAAAFALTALPAGAALAQEADCEVVEGSGSAAGDVRCPPEEGGDVGGETGQGEGESGVGGETVTRDEGESGVGGETVTRDEGESGVGGETVTRDEGETPAGQDDDAGVLPGRMDRPQGGAPDADEAAPAIESRDAELAATGVDADVALLAGLAALAVGGGALAFGRRRSHTSS